MRISDWSSDACSSDLREGRRGLVDGHERGRCHMHRIRWNTRLVDPLIEADLLCGGGVVLEQIGAQIGEEARAGLRLEGVTIEIGLEIGVPLDRKSVV